MNKENKFLFWITTALLLFMFLPLIISFSYQFIMLLFGETIHEGNSGIFSLFWLSLLTIPIGFLGFIILGIAVFINKRNKKKQGNYKD